MTSLHHPAALTALIQLRALVRNAEAVEQHWHDRAAAAESVAESSAALHRWAAARVRTQERREQLTNATSLLLPPAAPVLAKDPDARLVTSNAAPAAQPASL